MPEGVATRKTEIGPRTFQAPGAGVTPVLYDKTVLLPFLLSDESAKRYVPVLRVDEGRLRAPQRPRRGPGRRPVELHRAR
eukprot:1565488-Alexandrium_andersonii.AAC.1